MRRSGLTLIEFLVVVAIIAVLMGLLIPAVGKARRTAVRLADMNNLNQIGKAMHQYHLDFSRFPPARTRENGNDRWWFAETSPAGKVIDFSRGHLMPYLENNYQALQTPAKAPGPVYLRYEGGSGGYGYNYRYLAPFQELPDGTLRCTGVSLATVAHTSQTIAFCNAVDTTTQSLPTGSPSLIEIPLSEPPSAKKPSVHFRLGGVANVLFVDGHVVGYSDWTRNPPPPGDPPEIIKLREDMKVHDLGETDELWDRD
jgi:prepilin-type N-terminal cleavage/methylation domain-containing protein/prepilin-type processing-associated H-X9-DG protein